jgi:hypothetical protein
MRWIQWWAEILFRFRSVEVRISVIFALIDLSIDCLLDLLRGLCSTYFWWNDGQLAMKLLRWMMINNLIFLCPSETLMRSGIVIRFLSTTVDSNPVP